ncbi:LysR family transcriptional regulator [Acuticoccus mangrovi]|uniref:LysR family transcriptional regulator n=1 Tax=Acuticoccus mangrovi TaxID=2796142 RepID=A0A934IQK9_9HYPH|nr:LysR family transcriptional regulator [Acuticoccus mangrovi]
MSIKQIRAFVAVASAENFSKAAKMLNVSTSALSLTVQELERRVGQKLFERTTRTVTLTEAGATFLPVADRLLGEFARAIDDVARYPDMPRQTVRIGASQHFMNLVIPHVLKGLTVEHPNISIRLWEGTTHDMVSRIAGGELDFGITTLWSSIGSVDSTPLIDDRLGVLTSAYSALAEADEPLSWRDLRGQTMVSFGIGAGTRERVERDPHIGGMISQSLHEASSLAGLSALIESGAGSAITAALTAENFNEKRFRFIPLANPVAWRTNYLVTPKDKARSPLVFDAITALTTQLERFDNRPHMRAHSPDWIAVH